jgi:hypothetical protein
MQVLVAIIAVVLFMGASQQITLNPVGVCEMNPATAHFDIVASPEVIVERELKAKNYGAAECKLTGILLTPPCTNTECPLAVEVVEVVAPGEEVVITMTYAPRAPDEVVEYKVDLLWETVQDSTPPNNEPPVADAGPDQNVRINSTVQLDGSGSSDPDNDPLTYQWSLTTKPAGSTATLSATDIVNPTFAVDLPGVYEITLTVNDGTEDSTTTMVVVRTL